jgi:hypothetical protein
VENGRQGMNIERRRRMVGRNIVGRIRPLRVAGGGKSEDRKGPEPAAFEEVLHGVPQFLLLYYGKPEISKIGAHGRKTGNKPAVRFTFEEDYALDTEQEF